MSTKEKEISNFTKFWQRVKRYVDELFGVTFKQVVLDELPEEGEFKTVYFVPSSNPESGNTYDEFLWVAANGDDPTADGYVPAHFEQVGSTAYTSDHEVDTTTLSGKVVITKDGHSYAMSAEEIVKPAAPVLPAGDTFYNSRIVTITAVSGATIYYTIGGSTPTTNSNRYTSSITIGTTAAESTAYTIKAIAVKNGMTSDVSSQTYTCLRRVATPIFASVTGNKYSAERTVTFACSTTGATIWYKIDDGEWQEGSSVTLTSSAHITIRASLAAWAASTQANNSYVLNAKMCYIGRTKSSDVSSLISLKDRKSIEADTLAGTEQTCTFAASGRIWFIVPSGQTITKVTSGGYLVPIELVPNQISGYNCYRRVEDDLAGTYTYNFE